MHALQKERPNSWSETLILVNVTAVANVDPTGASSTTWRLPDKTMFNMGLDAAGTDVVLLAPSRAKFATRNLRKDRIDYSPLRSSHVQDMLRVASSSALFRASSDAARISPALVFSLLVESGAAAGRGRCGEEQPASLQLADKERTAGGFHEVPFNSQVRRAVAAEGFGGA
jgi:hypothetical protein